MAVTRIWPVRGQMSKPLLYIANPEKTTEQQSEGEELRSLENVIEYAVDGEKTEKKFYVSGVNCNPSTATDQFMTVKKQFGKEDGIMGYHAYQSFEEGEVDPETAHAIGIAFAKRVWGDDYQVLVTTHLNTNIIHNHFVVNSVSFKTGKRCQKKQWTQLSRISDEICKAYGKSVVKEPAGKRIPTQLAKAERAGKPTRLILTKEAIDTAIEQSTSLREFDMRLKQMGYTLQQNPNRKYWTIKGEGWGKPIRLKSIGEDYTNKRIVERLQENDMDFFKPFHAGEKKDRQVFSITIYRKAKGKGLKGIYLYYCMLLGYGQEKRAGNHNRTHYLLRDDLIKLDRITEEARLLGAHNIETAEQLLSYKKELQASMEPLIERRQQLRNALRRKTVIGGEEKKSEIAAISEQLKEIRKEVRLCEGIEKRSGSIVEKLDAVEKEDMRKEVREHERKR